MKKMVSRIQKRISKMQKVYKGKRVCMKSMEKGRKEAISNNMLLLVLVIIIFVSLLGTLMVLQQVEDHTEGVKIRQRSVAESISGRVAITIVPLEEEERGSEG